MEKAPTKADVDPQALMAMFERMGAQLAASQQGVSYRIAGEEVRSLLLADADRLDAQAKEAEEQQVRLNEAREVLGAQARRHNMAPLAPMNLTEVGDMRAELSKHLRRSATAKRFLAEHVDVLELLGSGMNLACVP